MLKCDFCSRSFLWVAVLLLPFFLSGCLTTKHLPPPGAVPSAEAIPAVLKSRTVAVNTEAFTTHWQRERQKQLAVDEINSWFGPVGEGDPDYVATLNRQADLDFNWTSFVGTILSFFTVPMWSTTTETSVLEVSAGDQKIFADQRVTRHREAFSVYSPFALFMGRMGSSGKAEANEFLLMSHRGALAQRVNADQLLFAPVAEVGTAAAFEQYLTEYPYSFFRGEALRGLSVLASHTVDSLAAHRAYLARYPDYGRFINGEEALWFVGPAGMQVMDIRPALAKGLSATLLAAQIRSAAEPYKAFDLDEVTWLTGKGIPDDVVAAMLDATTANAATPAANPAAPMAVLPAQDEVPPDAQAEATADPQTAGDIAAECAKKFVAIKVCERMPLFGAAICKSRVNKQYASTVCAVIQ